MTTAPANPYLLPDGNVQIAFSGVRTSADTARAMHAAEMRGQDMQNYQSHIVGQWVAEAECQRRIDAAVLMLTDALTWIDKRCPDNLALRGLDNPNRLHAEAMYDAGECARAAIRARGQK